MQCLIDSYHSLDFLALVDWFLVSFTRRAGSEFKDSGYLESFPLGGR